MKKTNLNECFNYSKPCKIANKCRNCRNRLLRVLTDGGREVCGCRKGFDINAEDKRKCFTCLSEGLQGCSD